ncbi:MAG: hypothetical protein ACREPK_04700, partial [Rhodanobacteraceae bacterium]
MRFSPKVQAAGCAAAFLCACATGAAIAATGTGTGTGTSNNDPFHAAEAWAFPKSHSPDPSVPKHAQAPKPDM